MNLTEDQIGCMTQAEVHAALKLLISAVTVDNLADAIKDQLSDDDYATLLELLDNG